MNPRGADHLKECMKAVGYEPEERGLCVGIAITATQDMLAGQFDLYENKLNYILSHEVSLLQQQIQNTKKKNEEVGSEFLAIHEKFILEVDRLLFKLMIHSKPSEVPQLFENGKRTTVQNAKRTMPLTQPAGIHLFDLGGFAFNFGDFGLWPSREVKLKAFFASLKQAAPNQMITILIENLSHTIQIAYHPDKNLWSITDSEQSQMIQFLDSEEMLSNAVYKAFQMFDGSNNHTFFSHVYLNSPDDETILSLQKWKVDQHQKMVKMMNTFSNEEKICLLHTAAKGDIETIKVLRLAQINFNEKWDDTTALFRAASYDEFDIVEYLLSNGANPNEGYSDGLSPLIIACENGCETVVASLITHGADPASECDDGTFPLLSAIECENGLITRLLMRKLENHLFSEVSYNELLSLLKYMTKGTLKDEVQTFLQSIDDGGNSHSKASAALNLATIPNLTLFSSSIMDDKNEVGISKQFK